MSLMLPFSTESDADLTLHFWEPLSLSIRGARASRHHPATECPIDLHVILTNFSPTACMSYCDNIASRARIRTRGVSVKQSAR